MNRREFLQCAAILVGGVGASRLGFALSDDQWTYLATAPHFIDRGGEYFTPSQRQLVTALAEAIIPATDTPGAIAAGVQRYLELMVGEWMNEQEKAIFMAGLAALEQDVPARHGQPFAQLLPEQQLQVLEEMESAAADSAWYEMGNILRDFVSDAPFICQLKELTVWGFFTSEVGAKQVLRYDPMPMRFDGDFPLAPDDSTWASSMP